MQRMVKKFVVAVLLGTVVLFVWGGFSHMVLFVGAGFKRLPDEDRLIESLKRSKDEQGLGYFLTGLVVCRMVRGRASQYA
ncbi:hypothetical protein ACQ86N_18145 [Puia sp. P3]|uniref:hypothetical protein n=1 Tax=Puia sp. P3 TaxID=3423952 RepID=UPI003D6723A4